ncbi:HK97-gp10 family putative phage morphogenesis protein [Macrococcus equi]|uniref:HK97-gp10 family putative phage morphogenesis protein n=1 Tax=Macrococcus equi TaxID=3395462 RepID=UPI0039BE8BD3
MSLEIEGADSISRNLLKMVRNMAGAEERIVRVGAEVDYEEIKNNLSVDSGKSKETITIGDFKRENNEGYVLIGWTEKSKVAYRVHFVEWGTVHQPPQLKITNALRMSQNKKLKAMKEEIKRSLKL